MLFEGAVCAERPGDEVAGDRSCGGLFGEQVHDGVHVSRVVRNYVEPEPEVGELGGDVEVGVARGQVAARMVVNGDVEACGETAQDRDHVVVAAGHVFDRDDDPFS